MRELTEFLSCDWGSTSFRLRWVSAGTLKVLREVRQNAGSKVLFEETLRMGSDPSIARPELYASRLRQTLLGWQDLAAKLMEPIPLVISGMASSSVGWRELPYASAPLRLDGSNLVFQKISWEGPPWISQTFLVSGVATAQDMMRGEEVEAIGLLADSSLNGWRENSMLILPGTHSKHVLIRNGSIVDFRTYMTGELFEVLTKHSLLKATVASDGAALDEASFDEGVLETMSFGLSGGLFHARTRGVLAQHSPDQNRAFLSGLLIGSELQELRNYAGRARLLLGASPSLSRFYERAFRAVAPGQALRVIPAEDVELSVVKGHKLFLERDLL